MPGIAEDRRRSCCARSATARPTGSSTSIPRTRPASARSPRACAARKSRFGGRLEPFFRLRPRALRGPRRPAARSRGRDDRRPPAAARGRRRARRAPRARATRSRGCSTTASRNAAVYNLLANELALLDAEPERGRRAPTRSRSGSSCCSPPGFAPAARRLRLAAASASTSAASRGAAGGVVCAGLRGGRVPARRGGPRASSSTRSARPLAEAPAAEPRALRQAERAIAETLEHHAHVRLRPAVA